MLPARLLLLLVVVSSGTGCQRWFRSSRAPAAAPAPVEQLAPSPRLILGRIVALDLGQKFAFVELATDAPRAALAEGTEFIARTAEFRETARLHASRYIRGRTLGTLIISGQPAAGDEVVWLAP